MVSTISAEIPDIIEDTYYLDEWHDAIFDSVSTSLPDAYRAVLEDEWNELASRLVGKKVIWHNDEAYPLVLDNKGNLAIEFDLGCEYCNNSLTVYLHSGLHSGAWCYAYDIDGNYLANLRDQSYICDDCSARRDKE